MRLVNALQQDREPFPDWLNQTAPKFNRSQFFGSRTVYYPGSGCDGHPVKLCSQSHAAHAFVYVDYGVSKEYITERLGEFKGYKPEPPEEVGESTLRPGAWTQHDEVRQDFEYPGRFASATPFALFVVLCREQGFDESHGPKRLAILFVGGDGFASYDALFCQRDGTPAPFLVVVQDHRRGGNFDRFDNGGILEQLASRSNVLPTWLLVAEDSEAWTGFGDTLAEAEHAQQRKLFLRKGSPLWRRLNP